MTQQPVTLDIVSDPVCPWCLIGKAELEAALAARPDHPFTIAWHPFQLNPDMPAEGMDRGDYLRAKFGDGASGMDQQIAERAAALGLTLAPVVRQPNTFDAHRVIHWAGVEHRQGPVVDAIMRAHWQESRDIGDASTLADIAGEAAMDREMIARLLASDADRDTIAARETHSRERGISAVPTFIIGNRHAVPGAQPATLWAQVIKDLTGEAPGRA
ncbi:DsbA family oxidoreductase [Paracoccus sp. TK19116]|uniref:DsbA family oxidoreductase n=1 Tax=Paracoccus albicereus TaxID=2922394 RepID=A0ABT1MTZ4_9RHOB|nr:DsbA family oxidoreductase [Paracoccus albicereus]MCQ0971800.1 DsbA family oxidoreductase [Paracoccus albicereus]